LKGTLIAWGIEGISPVVWEPESGTVRTASLGHRAPIASMRFSADSKRLTTASTDAEVITWDLATGKPDRSMRLKPPIDDPRPIVVKVALSPDGRFAAVNVAHDGVYLQSLPDNK